MRQAIYLHAVLQITAGIDLESLWQPRWSARAYQKPCFPALGVRTGQHTKNLVARFSRIRRNGLTAEFERSRKHSIASCAFFLSLSMLAPAQKEDKKLQFMLQVSC